MGRNSIKRNILSVVLSVTMAVMFSPFGQTSAFAASSTTSAQTMSTGAASSTATSTDSGATGTSSKAAPYAVKNTLSNITSDNDVATVEVGAKYVETLTAAEGYTLPDTVEVTLNGKAATAATAEQMTALAKGETVQGYDYVWNVATGKLSIPAATGDIAVKAAATATAAKPAASEAATSSAAPTLATQADAGTINVSDASSIKIYRTYYLVDDQRTDYRGNVHLTGSGDCEILVYDMGTSLTDMSVVLDNVSLSGSKSTIAFKGTGGKLQLAAGTTNTVNCTAEKYAAIDCDASHVVISGSGTLTANGGRYGAGIGHGAYSHTTATIDIKGGNITATGGERASGIGGAFESGSGARTDVSIYYGTGTVTANGGKYAAGIGSGDTNPDTTNVAIYGGTITANAGDYGAGIGSGQYSGGSTSVSISGGTVNATGGYEGAGIGSGGSNSAPVSVKVQGDTVITAKSGEGAAGIGAGYKEGGATTVTMTGGTLNRIAGGDFGAAIGGGQSVTGSLSINLTGGSANGSTTGSISGGVGAAGIGSGEGSSGALNITIGGTFSAMSPHGGKHAAGIGSGSSSRLDKISIGGSCQLDNVYAGTDAAGIGAGSGGTGNSSTVEISGGNINSHSVRYTQVQDKSFGAGIGAGNDSTAVDVTISGGVVKATALATYGAGIGGDGASGTTSKVTITGGTVEAHSSGTKGAMLSGWSGGAGIGGTEKNGFDVTITGGSVTATSEMGGAGIGGGYEGPAGTVNISGGTINATGGKYATGIGGTYKASSCTVNISGGRIHAQGSLSAGIGSAYKGDSSTVNISGGTIETHGDSCTPSSYPGIDADGDGSGKVVITGGNVMAVSGSGYTDPEVKPTPVNASGEKVARTLLSIPLISSGEQAVTTLAYKLGDASTYTYGTKDIYTLDSGKVYAYLPTRQSAPTNLYTATANSQELSAQDPITYTLHPISVTSTAFQNYIFDQDKPTPVASDFSYTYRDGEVPYWGGVPLQCDYDGAACPITVTAGRNVSGMGDISNLRYKKEGSSEYTTDPPVNVGTYGVYVDVATGDKYGLAKDLKILDLTIKRAPASKNPVTVTDYSGVYDGQEHTLVASAEKSGSTLYYSTDGGKNWSKTAPTFKTPSDSCTVLVKATNPNCDDSDVVSATITISKRPITITANSATVAYDGTEHSIFGGTYSGNLGDEGIFPAAGLADYQAMPYECKGTDVGDYTGKLVTDTTRGQDGHIHVVVEKATYDSQTHKMVPDSPVVDVSDCYVLGDDMLVAGTLSITPKLINVPTATTGLVYDGQEKTGVAAGDGYTLSGTSKATAVGTYTATATLTDTKNTTWADNTTEDKQISWSILADSTNVVTVAGYSGVYDGNAHGITATAAQTGNTLWYKTDGVDWTTDTSKVSFTDAGTHTVQVKGVNGSVETEAASATVQIDPKPILADVSIAAQTYTGDPLTPAATVKDGTATLKARTDYDISGWTNNTNVGTATYTVTLKGNYEGSVTGHFLINPRSVDVPAASTGLTYTGSEQTGVPGGAGYTVTGGSATDAGTYTATAKLDDKANTAWSDGTTADKQVTWSIAKASGNTVTATSYSADYDGTAHGIAAAAAKPGSTLYYSTDNVTWSAAAPTWTDVTSAQTVYVKATNPNCEDAYGSATVTISKASGNAVTAIEWSGTYDASAHTITASAAQAGSMLLYSTDGATWSTAAPTYTKAGAYTVYAKATNPNYIDSQAVSADVKIAQRPVTVTADDKSKAYGDADPALTATVSGTLGADSVEYKVSRTTGNNVGTYTITPAGEESQGNYAVSFVFGTLTISSADTNYVSATGWSGVYDGAAHTMAAVAAKDGSTLLYSTDEENWSTTAPTQTDAGTSTVYVKATNPNYQETAVASAAVTITQRPVIVTAADKSKAYGDADPKLTATVSGTVGFDVVDYTVSRAAGEAVGSYAITPVGEASQGNYSVSFAAGTLTIAKASGNTVTANGWSGPYDGKAHYVTATASKSGSTLSYSTDNVTWSTTAPTWTDVTETQTVYVKAVNPSYADAYGQTTVTVYKSSANSVSAEGYTGTYDGQDHTIAASASMPGTTLYYGTVAPGTATEGDWSTAAPAFWRAGTSTVYVKAENPNCEDAFGQAAVEISKRSITITASSATVTYDGTEHSVFGGTYAGRVAGDAVSAKDPQNPYASMPYICKGTDAGTYAGHLEEGKSMDVVVKVTAAHGPAAVGDDVTGCYDIALVSGTLTIKPAAVTVTANNKSMVEGDAEPALDATVTGLVNGEPASKIAYTLSRATGATPGTYAITPAGASSQGNYTVAFKPGILTIASSGDNVVTVSGYSGVYDGASHDVTAHASLAGSTLYYSMVGGADAPDWTPTPPSFTNVSDSGTVYVKAVKDGKADAFGQASVTIDPKPVAADVSSVDPQTYTGGAITPAATVEDGGTTLAPGTDYDISYANNIAAGTASYTVTLKGNYEGSVTGHFLINPQSVDVPAASTGLTYTGSEQTGVPDGAGYTVTGGSAIDAGTYTATAKLDDKANTVWDDGTTADKRIAWSITKASGNTVTATSNSAAYDGTAHGIAAAAAKPGSTLYYSTDGANWSTAAPTWKNATDSQTVHVKATNPNYDDATSDASVTIKKATLTAKYADETVGYGDAPAYAVNVTGFVNGENADAAAGYVAPTITDGPAIPAKVGSYPLTPANGVAANYDFTYVLGTLTVTQKVVTVDDIEGSSKEKTYTGEPITMGKDDIQVDVAGTTLAYGIDYEIVDGSYKDNVNVGTGTFTLRFMGNYSGTVEDIPGLFIVPADASSATVSGAVDKPYTGDPIEQKLTVQLNNKTLVEGTDYNVKYNDNVNVGTAGYTVEFIGNYSADSKTGTFQITPADASALTILPVADQTYTGSAIEPDLIVLAPDGKTMLEKGTDYDVTYADNVDAGTAMATLTFKGDFKGTASRTFTIAPADASGAKVSGIDAGYTYTGSAIAPAPTVTLNGKTLVAGTDYTVAYADNTDPGTASYAITFIGNYASAQPLTGTFAIAKRRTAELDAPDGVTQKGLEQVLAQASTADPDAKSIEVELIVIDANPLDPDAKAVQSALTAAGLTPGALYNAFLGKVVDGALTDIGSSNDVLVGVTYPFDFTGKDQVRVFARHAGQTYELTTVPNEYGEYIVLDRAGGIVTINAKRYSTFGIGYTKAAASPAASTGGSAATSSGVAAATAKTGDAGTPYALGMCALALAAAGGAAFARRRARHLFARQNGPKGE